MKTPELFKDLPAYANHIILFDEDCGRPLGVVKLTRDAAQDTANVIRLLTDHFCADSVILGGQSWSSISMVGALYFSDIKDVEGTCERAAHFEITHVYE